MRKYSYLLLFTLFIISSCSKDEDIVPSKNTNAALDDYELSVIDYFKEIALGFEYGDASEVIRKWTSNMKIFVGGNPNTELQNELKSIVDEINDLVTEDFRIEIISDSLQSNYYIFFGSGADYASKFPSQSNLVQSNWGLFSVFWNGENSLYSGFMYVDIFRADAVGQKHLLREELTQSIGLAKDSPGYLESIFQSSWTTTIEYAEIDKSLISLLYHSGIQPGMDKNQVESALIEILSNN